MYSELLLDDLDSQASALTLAQFALAWGTLQARIAQALTWAHQDARPSDMGLQHVSMARLYVLAWQRYRTGDGAGSLPPCGAPGAERPPTRPDPRTAQQEAATHVARAVEYLRLSNHRNYFPRGLLARAALCRWQGQVPRAHQDVEAVLDLAQSNAMDFYQADAYLEQAALHLAAAQVAPQGDHYRQAAGSLATAKALIDQMGYERRRRQVEELEARLRSGAGPCG
jgi:hypothetical protein